MSADNSSNDTTDPTLPDQNDVEPFVEEHRDKIERVVASDLPVAKYYQRLLNFVDEERTADV